MPNSSAKRLNMKWGRLLSKEARVLSQGSPSAGQVSLGAIWFFADSYHPTIILRSYSSVNRRHYTFFQQLRSSLNETLRNKHTNIWNYRENLTSRGKWKVHTHLWFLISSFRRVLNAACNFWFVARRVVFNSRRFGTLCLFHLHRRVDMKSNNPKYYTQHLWL
jgi:hypothetical protein